MTNKTVGIESINLDWDNPRLASYLKVYFPDEETFKNCQDSNLKQAYLVYGLVKYFDVSSLIYDMANSFETTMKMLSVDNILVTSNVGETKKEEFIVVEGNRRVCALKIINNPILLEDVKKVLEVKIDTADLDTFEKISFRLIEHFSYQDEKYQLGLNEFRKEINENVPVAIFPNRDELLNIVRKMHVVTKKRWHSIDSDLFDLNRFNSVLWSNPQLSYEDLINKTIESFGVRLSNEERDRLKKSILLISFYQYFLDVAQKSSNNEYSLYSSGIIKKYLPITDVLRVQIKNSFDIIFDVNVSDGKLMKSLSGTGVFGRDISKVNKSILDIILKIFNKKIGNGIIRNGADFKSFISDNNLNAPNTNDCFTNDEKLKQMSLCFTNDVSCQIIQIPLNSQPINILDYINFAVDDNGDHLSKDELIPKVDGQEYYMIPRLLHGCTFRVTFYSKRCTKPFKEVLTVKTYEGKVQIGKMKGKPISIPGKDIEFQLGDTINPLIEQLNKLSFKQHWRVIAPNLRCLIDESLELIRVKCPNFSSQQKLNNHRNNNARDNKTEGVVNLAEYIEKNDEIKGYLFKKYGIKNDNASDFVNVNYKDSYSKLQAFSHGRHHLYDENEVKSLALKTTKWLLLVQLIIEEES